MGRNKIIFKTKDKYEKVAGAIRDARQFFKGGERAEQEDIRIQVKAFAYSVKHNLQMAKVDKKFIDAVNEAEKEFKEHLKANQYSNKFFKYYVGKKVVYMQMQLFFDKIIDKVDYVISLEEPDFDMEKFRRQSKSAEGDIFYEIKKRKERK
jgi:hypothetical protein